MKFLFLLTLFLATHFTELYAQNKTITVSGAVYNDKNNNGQRDRKERGIKSVPVSNGKDIVFTDKKGRFLIRANPGQSVFPILPDGYRLRPHKEAPALNSAFMYIDPLQMPVGDTMVDFGATAIPVSNHFKVGAIGDVQVGSRTELEYAGKTIFSELKDRPDIDFNILLGDLFNNDLSLAPEMNVMMKTLPSPVWTVAGNHDRDTDSPEFLDGIFNRHYGASNYAFNYGNVHFVVLNNVFPTGKHSYEGRYTEDQLLFLAADLKNIPHGKPVVICQHIPLSFTVNKDSLFNLLDEFQNVLVLSGHTHRVGRYFYRGGRIQELMAGAASGTWWRGEKDASGVPEALMQCGAPRNYFVVEFNDGKYKIDFKAIGYDPGYQMNIDVIGNSVAANIFGGSDSTIVTMRINDSEEILMQKEAVIAPNVLAITYKNEEKIYPSKGNKINPLRRVASPHIWRAHLPEFDEDLFLKIDISARDSYGFQADKTIFIDYQ